jgi:hypothetical protein
MTRVGGRRTMVGTPKEVRNVSAIVPTDPSRLPAGCAPDAVSGSEREQAIAAVKRRRKFWDDLALYVGVNGVLWLVWALADRSTDGWIPWPTWVSAIWGFLLALDAIKAFAHWPGAGPVSETEIERELARRRRG